MSLDWSKAHFLIACVGMADAWMWSFEADNKWLMVHGTPGAGLVPFRLRGDDPASLEEVLFLANCISFDHDMPTVVRPSATTPAAEIPLIDPIVLPRGERAGLWYYDALEQALMVAWDVGVGDAVELRYDDDHEHLTRFEDRFANSLEPLALYAMATRQVDIMGEYLCLYRVVEWPNQDNGVSFITDRLADLRDYDFGRLNAFEAITHRATEVFDVYRERALKRIDDLRSSGMDTRDIAEHLYGIRNGLAHGRRGKSRIVLGDFGDSVTNVGADLPVIKLLGRIAVESA